VGFLLSRRWLLFAIAVAALSYLAYALGQWQFDRQQDREERNALILANLDAAPVPVADVLAVDRPVARADEWRRIEARGTYVPEDTVVIRYRTRDGVAGVDLVTPLRTVEGPAVLVDRGWLQTDNRGIDALATPDPPPGQVTVTGWVRVDATGRSAEVADSSARAISSVEIAPTLDYPVYGGFVDLVSETPPPAEPLRLAAEPDLGEGPHFFYGLQWWFFAALAVFGFGYLAFDEARARRRGEDRGGLRRGWRPGGHDDPEPGESAPGAPDQRERSIPPSTGSMTPVTKDAAGESRKAAARPNSSGRP